MGKVNVRVNRRSAFEIGTEMWSGIAGLVKNILGNEEIEDDEKILREAGIYEEYKNSDKAISTLAQKLESKTTKRKGTLNIKTNSDMKQPQQSKTTKSIVKDEEREIGD